MRISDLSSDVCSSDLALALGWLTRAYITDVEVETPGDRFFPEMGPEWTKHDSYQLGSGKVPRCQFAEYRRPARSKIGRASCRESVCKNVTLQVVADHIKKNSENTTMRKHISRT